MLKKMLKNNIRNDYWLFVRWYRARFGVLPAVLAFGKLIRNKGIGCAPYEPSGKSLFLRPGTTDQHVYNEIFVLNEYAIDLGEPLFIVDAGAHIGFSALFFASRYPKATIVAIEPEPFNFNLLCKNVRNYKNIKPVHAALWYRKACLSIQDSTAETWGYRVAEDRSGKGIPAVRVQDIMSYFNAKQIDLLKIDIEGSELEVLRHYQSWMKYIKAMIIELHDRFQPGCSEALEKALSGFKYNRSMSGESVVITDLRRINNGYTSSLAG